MHTKVIWGFFVTAFILDIFRSKYEQQQKHNTQQQYQSKYIPKSHKENSYDHKKMKREPMKAKFEGEEVKVTYDYENHDYINEEIDIKKNKKNKSLNTDIELRIQFCRS